jgi:hypothetical protein
MIKSRLAGPRVILYKVGGYQGVGHQLSTINIQKLNVKNRLSTLNTVNFKESYGVQRTISSLCVLHL